MKCLDVLRGVSDDIYKLEELARAAGTSARTVRYYVQRGLLPAPEFRAKDTVYGAEHLIRLKAIRRLQEAHLPLEAITTELASRTLGELSRLAGGGILPPPPALRRRNEGPRPAPPRVRAFTRIELAPGVELTIAEDAPAEARLVADRVLETFGPRRR